MGEEGERPRSARELACVAACWAAVGALAVVAWTTLAPPSLGGGVRFGPVTGSSMEPALHEGDLVVVRPSATYRTGDVVAYRAAGGRLVIHRVVDAERGALLVRGDANAVADGARPRAADVVGRLWLTVPDAGRVLGALRPPVLPLVCAALALLLLARAGSQPRRTPA